MKKIEILLLCVGLIMLGVLIKQMNMPLVISAVIKIGIFGFIFIYVQEIVAISLNSLGWQFAFTKDIGYKIGFKKILQLRIIGDGINYLTPSATLAGEWTKAVMLGKQYPLAVRLSSVAVSKITQAIGMVICSVTGIVWAFYAHVDFADMGKYIKGGGGLLGIILLLIVALEIRAGIMKRRAAKQLEENAPKDKKLSVWGHLRSVDKEIMTFISDYPLRFAMSVLCYLGAYVWGAFEVFFLCKFLGVSVTWGTALLVEMLSIFMDGIFFAVPGKAGTQEATKTAIFTALGFNPDFGFSFAISRHLREIAWALTGFVLYYFYSRKNPKTVEEIKKHEEEIINNINPGTI